MRNSRSLMALVLVASTACLPLLAANGGVISPVAGGVAVNGHAVAAASSALNVGDSVAVNATGTAHLTLAGSSVVAASNTSFRLQTVNQATQLRLTHGMVQVNGSLQVALNSRTVVPASARTVFDVSSLNGPNYVHVTSGSVALVAAGKSLTVHAGEAVTFDDQAPAAAGAGGGGGLALPVVIGLAAAAAIVTGVIVHEATVCTTSTQTCSPVVSPAVP